MQLGGVGTHQALAGLLLCLQTLELGLELFDLLRIQGQLVLVGRLAHVEDLLLHGHGLADPAIFGQIKQLLRIGYPVALVALCHQARLARQGKEVLALDHLELGPRLGVVEGHDDLALLDKVAVAHRQRLHDAAFEVLHRLALAFDPDLAGRVRGTGDRGDRRPGAEAEEHHHDDDDANQAKTPIVCALVVER